MARPDPKVQGARARVHLKPYSTRPVRARAYAVLCRPLVQNIEKSNPGIAFTDISKVLGDKLNKMTAVEEESYKEKALADEQRYIGEIGGYKIPQSSSNTSGCGLAVTDDQEVRRFKSP
ncbi:unnamed protein product [Rhodiola kirilowii]